MHMEELARIKKAQHAPCTNYIHLDYITELESLLRDAKQQIASLENTLKLYIDPAYTARVREVI